MDTHEALGVVRGKFGKIADFECTGEGLFPWKIYKPQGTVIGKGKTFEDAVKDAEARKEY